MILFSKSSSLYLSLYFYVNFLIYNYNNIPCLMKTCNKMNKPSRYMYKKDVS